MKKKILDSDSEVDCVCLWDMKGIWNTSCIFNSVKFCLFYIGQMIV